MPLSRDPLLAEIDDDLRAERFRKLWASLGNYILGVSAVILLGTAGAVGWQQHREEQAEALTAKLLDAAQLVQQEKPKEAMPLLRFVAESEMPSIAMLARLWFAESLRASDPAEARKWLSPLAGISGDDAAYRQYASLLAMDAKGPAGGFAALPDMALAGPFAHTLREERALARLEGGNRAGALADFRYLSQDAGSLPSMRERAQQMVASLDAASVPAPK